LTKYPDIAAFVETRDQSAIGVMKATQARGLLVLVDLSVVGTVRGSMSETAAVPAFSQIRSSRARQRLTSPPTMGASS